MMIIWWSKHVGVILNVLVCDIWINVLLQTSALVGPSYIVNWNARWNSEKRTRVCLLWGTDWIFISPSNGLYNSRIVILFRIILQGFLLDSFLWDMTPRHCGNRFQTFRTNILPSFFKILKPEKMFTRHGGISPI
jgi:hypothetical protein